MRTYVRVTRFQVAEDLNRLLQQLVEKQILYAEACLHVP